MRRSLLVSPLLALLLALPAFAAQRPAPPVTTPARASDADVDPDLPGFMNGTVDKQAYLLARRAQVALMRGLDSPDVVAKRSAAIATVASRQLAMGPYVSSTAWSPVGPAPSPNGQTVGISLPISGRVNAIAVHPTNPNIAYVGAASGGLFRTLDGGATWTALMDGAASLSIGAIAIDPLNPTIVFVGTGEGNLSLDSFMGVGLYRIRNADTSPVLEGPFETRVTGTGTTAGTGHAFLGNSIDAIAVDPTNDNRVFIGSTWGFGGLAGDFPSTIQATGLFFTETALAATPTFSLVGGIPGAGWPLATSLKFDPANAGVLLMGWEEFYDTNTGIYRSANANVASVAGNVAPAFTRVYAPATSANIKLTTSGSGAGMTVYAGIETSGGGTIVKSVNDGASFPTNVTAVNGYCAGQCWYDIAIAADPANPNIVLVGGQAGNNTLYRSTDGGASFTTFPTGLHADVHAIQIAPSNSSIVYHGNDGGIFKSTTGGTSWSSLNNSGLNTVQFISGAAHPSDPNFWIGGSQDNGTHWYMPNATWIRADFGDGGYAAIDQTSPDVTNVRMYHTYYNQQNGLVGYAGVTSTASASDGLWSFFGNGNNGIALAEQPNFYAPLTVGPGSPNTVYYGTDRLHRSADGGATNPTVSQAPIVSGVPLSAIGIAPGNDNVRLVGLNNGQIWGTVSGSSTLTNMTGGGMPATFVGRLAIDPSNANIAYAAFCGYGLASGAHVWKTSNLLSGTPTWAAAGSGIPDVPVDAFAIDPLLPSNLYAGTDIGVFQSTDGGATWSPYQTGLPTVPVFDLVVQPSSHVLRAATHGRGMWERALPSVATPTQLALTASEIVNGAVELNWFSADGPGQDVNLYRRQVPGDWARLGQVAINGTGALHYTDATVLPGRSYEYAVGMVNGGQESFYGQVWVTVPTVDLANLRIATNPTHGDVDAAFALAPGASATVDLVDVTGRRAATQVVTGTAAGHADVHFAARGVKQGLYWLRVTQGERSLSKRVTIVH